MNYIFRSNVSRKILKDGDILFPLYGFPYVFENGKILNSQKSDVTKYFDDDLNPTSRELNFGSIIFVVRKEGKAVSTNETKESKKSLLKDGMKVRAKNGREFLFINNMFASFDSDVGVKISSYDDDLKYIYNNTGWDIENIYQYKSGWEPVSHSRVITEKRENDTFKAKLTGNRTVVTLEDGSVGISVCLAGDIYNEKTGIDIAYRKAKIAQLKKELEEYLK